MTAVIQVKETWHIVEGVEKVGINLYKFDTVCERSIDISIANADDSMHKLNQASPDEDYTCYSCFSDYSYPYERIQEL